MLVALGKEDAKEVVRGGGMGWMREHCFFFSENLQKPQKHTTTNLKAKQNNNKNPHIFWKTPTKTHYCHIPFFF